MKQYGYWLRRWPLAAPLADAVKWTRNPRLMRRMMDDARRTWADAAFVRTLPSRHVKAKRVLILSMVDTPYNVKLESMLALELRRRGWRVQVLTSRVYTYARRIFAAFGITDLIPFESLTSMARTRRAVMAETARRAREPMDFKSVLQWTYGEAWIGPHILSAVSRKTFSGAPDPRDPIVRTEILRQLPTLLGFVHAAEQFLAAQRPDLILVNEPNSALGSFVDTAIAHRIPVVQFVQPSREDALVFKRLTRETRRIHPNSVARAMLGQLAAEPWTQAHDRALDEEFRARYGGAWRIQARNQPGAVDMSAPEIREALALDPAKKTAVLFSHVLWDANLFYGQDLFDNYGHWFVETVKAAIANPRVNWIVKLHPANLWKRELSGVRSEYDELRLIRRHVDNLPDHVRLLEPDTRISTLSLFRMIDAGITVRGSIGYELPCFGVPVITAGTGRYSGFGFTRDHDSAAAYLATLAGIETVPRLGKEATHLAKIHAYALLARRPWQYRSFRSIIGRDITDPMCQNMELTAPSFEMIDRNGDLAAFADWAIGDVEVDFLAPDPLAAPASAAHAAAERIR
jgi:hypothetical protein